jgi:CRP/FNR family transcriptional regulator
LLKGFAVQGLVRLGREQITVIDPAGLQQLADGSADVSERAPTVAL